MENLIADLQQKDTQKAYESLKLLINISEESDLVYPFMDTFVELMEHENSYFRTRGLLLIAANAKWDKENKIDEIIDDYLKHILDDKPITSRQCIKVLPQIVTYKPELAGVIKTALMHADPTRYRDSMSPLVQKDIMEALHKTGEICVEK